MNQTKLVLLMMLDILIVKISLRELSDRILKYKIYEITRNCKDDEYQRALGSMVHELFDKTGSGVSVNEQLAGESHKPVIKNSKEERSI